MYLMDTEEIGEVTALLPENNLDEFYDANALKSTLNQLLVEGKRKFVIDMRPVQKISTYVCGALAELCQDLRKKGGDLKLYGLQKGALHIIKLTKAFQLIECYATEEEAIASFSS